VRLADGEYLIYRVPTSTGRHVSTTADLDARYGRGRGNSRRSRIIAIVAGAVGVVAVVAWVVWGGLLGPDASLEARDLGFEIIDDGHIRVEYEVTSDAGAEVSCAVQALNESFTVVGWKIVELPVSEQRTRSFTEELRTSELAVSGLIYRCWLL
jgi:hypothetical protein